MARIFMIHSCNDAKLAEKFCKLLETSMQLGTDSIYCSSLANCSGERGESISDKIRENIQDAVAVIALITRASLKSRWVNFEMGAAWDCGKWIVPAVSGVSCKKLPDHLRDLTCTDLRNELEILQLLNEIGNRCGYPMKSMAQIADAVKVFLRYIPGPLSGWFVTVGALIAVVSFLCLWQVTKTKITVYISPHYIKSKEQLKKEYNERYRIPFFKRYKFNFVVTDDYKGILTELYNNTDGKSLEFSLVSPYTWIQFQSGLLSVLDTTYKRVDPSECREIGQKKYVERDDTCRTFYESCLLFYEQDTVIRYIESKSIKDSTDFWDSLSASLFIHETIIINQRTISTSTAVVAFISLIEKGIPLEIVLQKLRPADRYAIKAMISRNKTFGAFSKKELEKMDSVYKCVPVLLPAKIPNSPLVTLQKTFQQLMNGKKGVHIMRLIRKSGLINSLDNGEMVKAYEIFKYRVGTPIINTVRRDTTGPKLLRNNKLYLNLWVPCPLNPDMCDRGFNYINMDILREGQRIKSGRAKELKLLRFTDGPDRLNFDMEMDSVCVIKPDSILPVSRYSGRMTIIINPNQLPEPYATSPQKLIGLHVCQVDPMPGK